MSTFRRACIILVAVLAAWIMAAPTAQADSDSQRLRQHIDLPDGFQPEGIAIGDKPVAYLGSLADGDIYASLLSPPDLASWRQSRPMMSAPSVWKSCRSRVR